MRAPIWTPSGFVCSMKRRKSSRLREAAVDVPDGVRVWRVEAASGQFVDAGAPLFSFIDCRSLFLDIRVDDTVLTMISRDHPVRFRLFGSSEFAECPCPERARLSRGDR